MAADLETLTQSAEPAWWASMMRDYQAGMANVFVLHGAVADYVEHPRLDFTAREYLEGRLSRTHTVASFAPDQGVTFPGGELIARESRARLDQVLGVVGSGPERGGFDATAALRTASGGSFGGGSDEAELPQDAPSALKLLVDFVKRASETDPGVPQRVVRRDETRQTVPARAAVVVERLDLICPPEDKARLAGADRALLALLYRAGTSVEINRNKNLVILLAPSLEEVHPDLRLSTSGIRTIEVKVPEHDQRLAYIARMLPAREVELDGLDETQLASETAGLGRRHIEDIAMRAAQAGGRLGLDLVRARKRELIAAEYAEVLEILDPDVTFEMIGGHERVKTFLRERVLRPLASPNLRHRTPMGLLFSGPSGTGKTFLAAALAHEARINCVGLAPDKIRGSFVGESEKKLSRALEGIEAMAPCVVFVDELDQKVKRVTGGSGGGGDSVEGNIFGKLLEFFSRKSNKGRILLVGATNRPDNIDAAFKRPGRIDHKIPLLPPVDAAERASTLAALCPLVGVPTPSEGELLAIGEQTDLFTQAELAALIEAAGALIDLDGLAPAEAFRAALDETVPATEDIAWHTDLAIAACNNRTLVPERYQARVGKQLPRSQRQPAVAAGAGRVAISEPASDDGFGDDFAE